MNTLTIFYDPHCGLCAKFRAWLDAQPKRITVRFVGHDTAEAERIFPGIHTMDAGKDLVVMGDDGQWWQGPPAWLTCLWSTRDLYPWAFRLASPALQPFVKQAIHLLSENRLTFSRLAGLRSDQEISTAIRSEAIPTCETGSCAISTHPNLP